MYRRGLGAVWSADGTSFSYPSQCAYNAVTDPLGLQMLFAQFSSDCAPPTPAQLIAMQQAQLLKVAAVNPDLAAQGVAAGSAAAAALAKTDPNAADYYAYQANPLSEAILGPTATNWIYGIDPTNINPNNDQPNPTPSIPGWVWIAGVGLLALLVVGAVK